MPPSRDPLVVALKIQRFAGEIPELEREILNQSALVIKKSVTESLRGVAPRLRLNVGKKGASVGVRYEVQPHSALVRATGPVHLLESDTKAHRIPREKIGRGRARRVNRKPIYIPGVGIRASAMHPGTKGRHPWARGVTDGLAKTDQANGAALRKTVKKVFG